ncbi:MAG: mandelate racemase/muconate lactonizing enzyme family protein [Paracoccaceae bacterium]
MKITRVTSHVLSTDMERELGYSQQYYAKRTAHLVEVETSEGVTGWGECFGPGPVALANKTIVEQVLQPMVLGRDALAREAIWAHCYNMLRDHGQKGMPIQALSGLDIALWDIAGKVAGLPLYRMLGGPTVDRLPVYGYGMMLERKPVDALAASFREEAAAIREMGFAATKMKVGLGVDADIRLATAVREGVGDSFRFAVDANHCYNLMDAMKLGYALDELDAYWFEEPVAPEDRAGYAELRAKLRTTISGGEAEFTRWGWRDLLEARAVGLAQPEVCGLGGISEYLKVVSLCHAHLTPVINHVWGSAVAVATNMHLLAAMAPMPGGLHPWEPMLEFDTTPNTFRDDLSEQPLNIQSQVKASHGSVSLPSGPGIGITPERDFINHYKIA